MATSKAVAKSEDLFNGGLPQERPDWMGDNSRGSEGVGVDDMVIPRLEIVQDLSPHHKESKPEYIEGAKPGMLFNSATSALYGDSVYIVPVLFRKEYVIWKDLNAGGGYGGAYPTAEEGAAGLAEQLESGRLEGTPDQFEILQTHQQFCLLVHPESTADEPVLEQIVLSMAKSKMKVSRKWNTTIQAESGDRFVRMYKASVVEDQNAAGQDYYNLKIERQGFVPESIFRAAETFYEAIKAGAVDVSRTQESAPVTPEHNAGEVGDDEPF